MNAMIIKIAIIFTALVIAAGAKLVLNMPDNNPIEKAAITMIEKEAASLEGETSDEFENVDLNQ